MKNHTLTQTFYFAKQLSELKYATVSHFLYKSTARPSYERLALLQIVSIYLIASL